MSGLVRAVAASLPATVASVIGLGLLAIAVGILGFGLRVTGAAALYFIVWWIGLFAVLPFQAQAQAEDEETSAGNDPGAPSMPALREKAIWTSIVATAVFTAVVAVLPLAGL